MPDFYGVDAVFAVECDHRFLSGYVLYEIILVARAQACGQQQGEQAVEQVRVDCC